MSDGWVVLREPRQRRQLRACLVESGGRGHAGNFGAAGAPVNDADLIDDDHPFDC